MSFNGVKTQKNARGGGGEENIYLHEIFDNRIINIYIKNVISLSPTTQNRDLTSQSNNESKHTSRNIRPLLSNLDIYHN